MYNLRCSEEDLRILHDIIYKERGELMPLISASIGEDKKILRRKEHKLTAIDKRIKNILFLIMIGA